MDDSEPLALTDRPLAIVQQGPGKIPLHRHALGTQPFHLPKMPGEIINALRVPSRRLITHQIIMGHAVFRHILWQAGGIVVRQTPRKEAKPLGMDFPPHIGFGKVAATS